MDKLAVHNFDTPFKGDKPSVRKGLVKRGSLVYLSSHLDAPQMRRTFRPESIKEAPNQDEQKTNMHRKTYYRGGDQFIDNLLALPALQTARIG